MRKLWCLEVGKIWEKNSDGNSKLFLLKMNWREWRGFKKEERGGNFWPIKEGHLSPAPWGARGPHGGREPLWSWGPRLGPHVASWPLSPSRTPSRSSAISWAFELQFRIRFRITNRDSLTHDKDYTNLKKWLRNHLEKRQ